MESNQVNFSAGSVLFRRCLCTQGIASFTMLYHHIPNDSFIYKMKPIHKSSELCSYVTRGPISCFI